MPHVIYKYELPPTPGNHVVSLPDLSRVLSFGNQNNKLSIWAVVNPDNELVERSFHLHWTGQALPLSTLVEDTFIGTTQVGPLVFHLFERKTDV